MSSSSAVIEVHDLGKRYELGARGGAAHTYRSLREEIAGFAGRLRRRDTAPGGEADHLWALRNVSFEVSAGERLGIIGRNGAGKSTLLKLLSRITAPTEGRAVVRGRLGSLLEVGTGFHPELTGRDNIFLSGAVLGMTRSDITRKIDEIVDFAGIARFLETPVKRYSTGMYLRLAFSVAAHLEPDILLVDEVLAVGDAEFQKKCLGRMEEISGAGRTVLFVSHSMPAVLRLCERVVLLDKGGVVADGSPQEVVRAYLDAGAGSAAEREWASDVAPGDNVVRMRAARVRRSDGTIGEDVDISEPVDLEVEYLQLPGHERLRPSVNLHITNEDGVLVFVANDYTNSQWREAARPAGIVKATCRIPGNFLAEGRFFVMAAVSSFNPTIVHASEPDAVSFHVIDETDGDGARGIYVNHYPGVIRPIFEWMFERSPIATGERS